MKKTMKAKAIERRALPLTLALGSLLAALILIGAFLYMRVNALLNAYMETQGKQQARTLAELVERQFQAEWDALHTLADGLPRLDEITRTAALRAMQDAASLGELGVQGADGSPVFGDAYAVDEFPCIDRAAKGENAVSFFAGKGLMFCVPASAENHAAFVVRRLYPESVLFDRFGADCYGGAGRVRILDASSQTVIPSAPQGSDVFAGTDVESGMEALESALSDSVSAAAFRTSGVGEVMLFAAEIQNCDFHLLGYVPKNAVMEGAQPIGIFVIAVFVILAGAILAGGYLLIGLERKSRESDALREAARIAEKSSAAKSEFLSNMSHDIRTPMNAIIGFTNLALRNPQDTERVTEYLGKIQASSSHLLSLINDVLEMSRIESGKIELDETLCSLPEILHDLNTIIIGQVEAKQQELMMDAVNVTNENVYCDKLRVNQILLNLASNAIKYTPAGGKISVRIIQNPCDVPGYAAYEIRVKDNGIGMSPEFASRVFEAFEREQTSTISGIQGTGLGMAITKSIVDLMGGSIRVETELNKGSEFIVDVNLRVTAEKAPAPQIPELNGLRALVVDDDFNTCDSATKLLGQLGMRSDWSMSGKEAVLRAKHANERGDSFKVFLIDWKLPDLNGIEAVRQIRMVVGKEIPILLMTAYDWPSIKDEAISAGVNGFCNKPLFLSELHSDMMRVIQRTGGRVRKNEKDGVHFDGSRLLLVDDIEMNREIAVAVLEMSGFEVEEAHNGAEAVEKVTKSAPGYFDAVLMDIQMPVMNGYDAARAIRASDSPNASIPIIAMTANAFDEDKKAAYDAGMDGHVAKPIDVDKLMDALGKILRPDRKNG